MVIFLVSIMHWTWLGVLLDSFVERKSRDQLRQVARDLVSSFEAPRPAYP